MQSLIDWLKDHPHCDVSLLYCNCRKVVLIGLEEVKFDSIEEEDGGFRHTGSGQVMACLRAIPEEEFNEDGIYESLLLMYDEGKRKQMKIERGEIPPDFHINYDEPDSGEGWKQGLGSEIVTFENDDEDDDWDDDDEIDLTDVEIDE